MSKEMQMSPQHPLLTNIKVFITYREIYHEEISFDKLVGLIKLLRRQRWISIASMISVFLYHYEGELEKQKALAHHLLPKELLKTSVYTEYGTERFFFHKAQALALFRLSLLHATDEPDSEKREEEKKEIIARCLLGISDLLYRAEEVAKDTKDLKSKIDLNVILSGTEKAFVMYMLQIFYFGQRENMQFTIGRFKDMLFDIPDDQDFDTRGYERAFLKDTLQKQCGLSLSQYAALTFGILARYLDTQEIFKENFHFPIDMDVLFSNMAIPKELSERYFAVICQTVSEFVCENGERRNDIERIKDFHSFMLKPLIGLDGSRLCYPTSLLFLQRLLDIAFPWIVSGGDFDERVRRYWGYVFEFYCHKICKRIELKSGGRARYFPEFKYIKSGQTKSTCDGIIVYDDSALMMEFKIKQPRLTQTVIDGDYDSLVHDIRQAFIESDDGKKAAKQINDTICDIRDGYLHLHGVHSTSITRYFPIVVTLQSWPLGPIVYEVIRRQVKNAGLLRRNCIVDLEVWSCEELEYIESLASSDGRKIIDIPNTVLNKLNGGYSNMPMDRFLGFTYGFDNMRNEYVLSKMDQMFKIVLSTLQSAA